MLSTIKNTIRLQPEAPTQPGPVAPPSEPAPATKPSPVVVPLPTPVKDPDRRDDVKPSQFPHPICPTRNENGRALQVSLLHQK